MAGKVVSYIPYPFLGPLYKLRLIIKALALQERLKALALQELEADIDRVVKQELQDKQQELDAKNNRGKRKKTEAVTIETCLCG
ncbi:hypothetical protein L195_g054668 [Trifolium pratense]|uniref:Uncharacterized protein n=1 Tax=Trifolium pratense TaxID=57577 RepID=A0A2K3KHB5_TRIPR|nr:hypothetical protein L195_g054668 [Trifolium pratense]